MLLRISFLSLIAIVALSQSTEVFGQAYKADIGFNELLAERGSALEDGTGLNIAQIEAPNADGNYGPNQESGQFNGCLLYTSPSPRD